MILGIAGICFAGAAIYGALHWHHVPGRSSFKIAHRSGSIGSIVFYRNKKSI